MKAPELKHFPLWAPQYFAYMGDYYEHGDPFSCAHGSATTSFLAKILGLFTVQVFPVQHTNTDGTTNSPPPSSPSASHVKARNLPDPSRHGVGLEPSRFPSDSAAVAAAGAAAGASTPPPPLPPGASLTSRAEHLPPIPKGSRGVQYYVLMENTAASRFSAGGEAGSGGLFAVAFDLKGSQRNRNAPPGALVKLDADFVHGDLHQGRFFFCRAAEKQRLMDGLSRDVRLLRAAGIMDYSLFVTTHCPYGRAQGEGGEEGADEAPSAAFKDRGPSPSLNISVIDYLHPFTGAKLLESRMKSGLDTMLGHAGRDPTIIDPVAYAERFLRWVNCYFREVPERQETGGVEST